MIGYYVHHHGRGHLTRALAITAHLDEDVVFFSSLPTPGGLRPRDRWVRLSMDVPPGDMTAREPTANGRLHWAPLNVDGLLRRSAELLRTLADTGVRRLVVDVSVEIAVLARTSGVPVTVMAMPGERTDPPHQLAYRLADQIIAPWSDEVYRPTWLAEHAGRTHFVGYISRFEGLSRDSGTHQGDNAVLLSGAGGTEVPDDAVTQLQAALPGYRWTALGGRSWTDDPWSALRHAGLIVTHAGQNALADAAAAATATIVLPQPRPFDEQHTSAAALHAAGLAVCAPSWPTPTQWPELASAAGTLNPDRWCAARVDGAAARAAQVLAA